MPKWLFWHRLRVCVRFLPGAVWYVVRTERVLWRVFEMAEGTIKRLTDKGFGFIDTGGDRDMFFHSSNLDGVRYDELHEEPKSES